MPTTLVLTAKHSLWRKVHLIFTWSTVKLAMMLIHKCSSVENVEKCLLHWSTFNNISGDMKKITIQNTSKITNVLHKMKTYRNTHMFIVQSILVMVRSKIVRKQA